MNDTRPLLRIGIAGLGGAARLVLPAMDGVDGVALAGAADIRPEARAAFASRYHLPVFESVEAMCRSSEVDAIWIETPNHLHCEHVLQAVAGGKHVICAKPLAVSIAECDRMIAAAERAGVLLIQGHSKIFDSPVRAMREVIASGRLGRVIQLEILLFNDWLQRPRLAEELDPERGGGIVLRQGPHLVDIATYLVGRSPVSVRSMAGRWDPGFDAVGNFAALLNFGDGVGASLTLNGYGYFDSTELHWGIGAMGGRRPDGSFDGLRERRSATLSPEEKYGLEEDAATIARRRSGPHPPFFGLCLVSCEKGAIRQSPDGLYIYSATGREDAPVPPNPGRAAELIELRDALASGRPAFPDGRWARATLETCLAIQSSAREDREIALHHQVAST